jgi:hypothetical protein
VGESFFSYPALIPQRASAPSETCGAILSRPALRDWALGVNENLRAHRLGLLQTLVKEFSSIADFSEIVTEKKS